MTPFISCPVAELNSARELNQRALTQNGQWSMIKSTGVYTEMRCLYGPQAQDRKQHRGGAKGSKVLKPSFGYDFKRFHLCGGFYVLPVLIFFAVGTAHSQVNHIQSVVLIPTCSRQLQSALLDLAVSPFNHTRSDGKTFLKGAFEVELIRVIFEISVGRTNQSAGWVGAFSFQIGFQGSQNTFRVIGFQAILLYVKPPFVSGGGVGHSVQVVAGLFQKVKSLWRLPAASDSPITKYL